ncbi:MAG: hypothetical protein HRU28_05440, partial [Rhizobiales bacterium]|nr:hypothetical protein [Hyphomicrobiales bacterium]
QIKKLVEQKKRIEKAIFDLTLLCDEVDKVIEGKEQTKNLTDIIYGTTRKTLK